MTDLNTQLSMFYILKEKLTEKYRQAYPEFSGRINDLKGTGIINLQVMLEQEVQGRISEKWFYTHIKPDENQTLPRTDALDMLCRWLGYRSWDDFIYQNSPKPQVDNAPEPAVQPIVEQAPTIAEAQAIPQPKAKKQWLSWLVGGTIVAALAFVAWQFGAKNGVGAMAEKRGTRLLLIDALTHDVISGPVNLELLANGKVAERFTFKENEAVIVPCNGTAQMVIAAPYFFADTVTVACANDSIISLYLAPDYYSRLLVSVKNKSKGESAILRDKLDKMLNDNGEFIQVEDGQVEVEFFNKQEFIMFLLSPAGPMGRMKLLECKYNNQQIEKVVFTIQQAN